MMKRGARELAASSSWLMMVCATSIAACSLLDNLDDLSAVPADQSANAGASGAESEALGGAAGSSAATAGSSGDPAGAAGAAAAGASGTAGSSQGEAGSAGAGSSGGAGSGALGANRIFWLEKGSKSVHAANADGTQNQTLYTVTGGASAGLSGLALDTLNSRLYFADEKRQRIQSSNLDGTDVVTVLTGLDAPSGIDLDVSAGTLYFSERGATPRVQRAKLDGTPPLPLITSLGTPSGLAVDAAAGKLYLVDDGLDAVFASALDGSDLTNLNISGVTDPVEISIDTLEGKLYWSERAATGPKIRRANPDGSAVEDIVTPLTLPGFSTAAGVEVDVAGRLLYFVDGGTNGSILRCNLDGTGTVPVIGGLDDPSSLTLGGP